MQSVLRYSRVAVTILPCVGLAIGVTASAAAQDERVTIEGGIRQDNPQWFDWTVTNRYSSPIVQIEIPHSNGDLLEPAPGPGWRYKLKGDEASADLGKIVCRTWAEKTEDGIAPSRATKFSMRINRDGALPRKGKMRVKFADGTELVVAGIELPSGQQTMERGIVTITLGVAFILVLIIQAKRRRAAAPPTPPTS